jgi:hypothetical protein
MGRLSVRIDEPLKRALADEAKARGVRPSDVVREALEAHLKPRTRPGNCLDIARRIGLIGSAKGLPPDLSTNRDHFEGFGRG